MIATATSAVTMPYSMAVTPRTLAENFSQQIAQHGNKRQIGRRHRECAQICRTHPFQGQMFFQAWPTFPFPADVKWHQEMKSRIRVGCERERRETIFLDLDAQFFAQFPNESILRPLRGLHLAARKLP